MTKNVEKILKALRSSGGILSVSEVSGSVSHNVSKVALEGYLRNELGGIVEETRFRKNRRTARCWQLTSAGWALANVHAAKNSPLVLSREAVVHQMNRLAREGDSWAIDLLDSRAIAEAVKAEVPTQRDVVNMLWRMWETKQKPARLFATRYLKLMGEGDKVREALTKEKAEARSRKRKSGRRLDEAAIARINRARAQYGMDPIDPSSAKPALKPSPVQHSAPLAHDLVPMAPKPVFAPIAPITPQIVARQRRVFRFPSGAIFEHAKLGGGRVFLVQRDGKLFDDTGVELIVVDCQTAPGVGWELDDSGVWHRKGEQPQPIQPEESFKLPFNAPAKPTLLPSMCRHRPVKPDGSCMGHCSSPLYQPLR